MLKNIEKVPKFKKGMDIIITYINVYPGTMSPYQHGEVNVWNYWVCRKGRSGSDIVRRPGTAGIQRI